MHSANFHHHQTGHHTGQILARIHMRDDKESLGLFEPLMIAQAIRERGELNDMALELAERSGELLHSLPQTIVPALADLVRSMNCYYSNLIEGHNTHPVDIERALNDDYSADSEKRNLQLEAKAHITVQHWIDEGGMQEMPTSPGAIREIHKRFCERLPPQLLRVQDPSTQEYISVIPGALRTRDVQVGRHVAISPGAVPRFLQRLHEGYRHLGRIDSILATACAHHRLLWIHPFMDGNGRVARLMSYAMLRSALGTSGLWSIARGLARSVATYKQHLAACDMRRRNDLDGRGTLSQEALIAFTRYFLSSCIDQVSFMQGLMQPERLRNRIMVWAQEQIRDNLLPPNADVILKTILYQGVLERAEAAKVLGLSDRAARRVTSALLNIGALTSSSTRAPLYLAFPATFADRWMPGLFPDM